MLIALSIFTSFVISLMMLPYLIKIAGRKNIFDEPGKRKLHIARTPLLGGVAIFSGTIISFLFFSANYFNSSHLYLLTSLIILFIAGFFDDLHPLRPGVKLFLQVIAAAITVLFAGIDCNGLHGLFGIHTLTGIFPSIASILLILVVVNAFNFIDGIDGLAASIGIVSSAFFGILFLSMNDQLFALLSFALCGSLVAFLIYNFSPAKIFMGDTGSLVTGFIFSLFTIQLTEETRATASSLQWLNYQSAPVIVLALLIIPIVDFIQVTSIRLLKGQSPIHADNNHIHHVLVDSGMNHRKITLLLIFVNLLFLSTAFLLRNIDQSILFFSLFASGILLSQLPFLLFRKKMKKTVV